MKEGKQITELAELEEQHAKYLPVIKEGCFVRQLKKDGLHIWMRTCENSGFRCGDVVASALLEC
jgi:hypothetical protein